MIVQFAIVVLARLWTCYGEHPSIRSKNIIKHSFSSKVLGQNKEKESSLSHMLGAQDDYSDRNGGLSIEFLLLSRVEVRAEEGSGDIPKVHVSNRRKKDLWSKCALAFAEFLQLQRRLLQPTRYGAPESWRWCRVLSRPQAKQES